jgi:licheninase
VVRERTARDESGELVWSDEFDEDGAPNADHWNVEVWAAGVVNDEDQAYTARSKNVRVEDGNLVIETHREDYDGARYTSGRLQSMGKADFLYGRIEVRARLPEGQGTWPAIWMLSSSPFTYATTCTDDEDWQGSDDCDAWPNSGEIDIMEHVGYQMNHVHGTVHSKDFHWTIWNQRKGRILLDDVADEFQDRYSCGRYAISYVHQRGQRLGGMALRPAVPRHTEPCRWWRLGPRRWAGRRICFSAANVNRLRARIHC